MSNRRVIPLLFGGGVDRDTGVLAVDPTAWFDLRNVHLRNGRFEVRRGMALVSSLITDTGIPCDHVLAIQALRSDNTGVAVGYREDRRELHVFATAGDATGPRHVGLWFTLPAGAGWPQVSALDMNGRVFLVHHEPTITRRAPTVYYEPVAALDLLPLAGDLDGTGAAPIKFFGAGAHGDYLLGWGYGVPEEVRPELVRISKPGEHTEFLDYANIPIGERGDPVIAGGKSAGGYLFLKSSEVWRLVGSSFGSFGAVVVDPDFGVAGPRLAVTVGGTVYLWSASGPRLTSGGPTEDLGLPLDLGGPSPSELLDGGRIGEGFAYHDRDRREVVFVFGRWGYALALDGPPRWSFREFGTEPNCAGPLFPGTATSGGGAPTGHPEFHSFPVVGPNYLDVRVVHVGSDGDETLELWRRPHGEMVWALAASAPVNAAAQQTIRASGLAVGATYDVAVRYRRSGLYTPGYFSFPENPALWPEVSRGTGATSADAAPTDAAASWVRTSSTIEEITVSWTNTSDTLATWIAREYRDEDGSWLEEEVNVEVAPGESTYTWTSDPEAPNPIEGERRYRFTVRYLYDDEGPVYSAPSIVSCWAGPLDAPIRFDRPQRYVNDHWIAATVTRVTAGAIVEVWKRESHHLGSAPYDSGWVLEQSYPAGPAGDLAFTDTLSQGPGKLGTVSIDLRARQRTTAFGVTDFSDYSPEQYAIYEFDPTWPW